MPRIRRALALLVGLGLPLLQASPAAAHQQTPQAGQKARAPAPGRAPNIIVILADDLGVETLGVYGGTSYETPELDRIAAEGMRFENGHSQPLCTPTRVKLMTGLHNYRNYREFMYLDPADVTFAHMLAQAGYRTVISGKWQLTNNLYMVHEGASPQQAGFDEHRLWQLRREGRGSRYWGPTLVTNDRKETWGEDVFGPDLTNDFVLDAIDEHAAADPATRRPLFIYYPMALPHDPFVVTPRLRDQPPGGRGSTSGDAPDGAAARASDTSSNQERFAGMVAYMDHLVGRVRAKLVEHGLERNTLVLFIGDNGTSTRIASVRDGREVRGGKGRSLQTGSHVPYLAWWPGTIPGGQTSETLVDVGDVFPTLVEAAGAGLPPGLDLDGESLLPMLTGSGPAPDRDALFIHYESRWYAGPPARYAFDERFKRYDDGRLFDLDADPNEQSPLDAASLAPEDAARVEAIDALLASKPGAVRIADAWRPPTPAVNRFRPPAHRPNILLIVADDMTFSDAGALGNPQVHTPNLDRLAEQGTTFTHMYTATAMCSPTRHMLYTGQYPVRSGAYPNHAKANPGTKSVVHYLSGLGYRVGLAGKSHVAPEEVYPFEKVAGRDLDPGRIGEFIGRDANQPFALIVASTEPHQPWSKGDPSRYDAASLKLPPYFVDTPETREALTRYYAEITFMDGQLGQVLDLLREHAAHENTLTMFYSEQGISGPLAKWTLYEAGIRTSLVARWSRRIPAGRTSGALLQINDLLPTWIEAAGGAVPPEIEGRSMLDLLLEPGPKHRKVVYGIQTTTGIIANVAPYPIRSIRDERYKLIWNIAYENRFTNLVTEENRDGFYFSWRDAGETDPAAQALYERYQHRPEFELFDLEADPHEMTNLAEAPEHRERLAALHARLQAWMKDQGDLGLQTEVEAPQHQSRPR